MSESIPEAPNPNVIGPGGRNDYAYVDKTKELVEQTPKYSEASLAELNPAFYPKDAKPEALWNEAEKEGAEVSGDAPATNPPEEEATDTPESETPEAPSDPPVAPGDEEETSEEAADARAAEYRDMGLKDLEEGQPAASTDPEKAVSAEEAEEGKGKRRAAKVKRAK